MEGPNRIHTYHSKSSTSTLLCRFRGGLIHSCKIKKILQRSVSLITLLIVGHTSYLAQHAI